MKSFLLSLICCFFFLVSFGQTKDMNTNKPDSTKKIEIVDAACGQCQLGLTGADCDLAVRINGKAYYVDGTNIDSHGDAHAADGFCNAVRKAEIQGALINDRYRVTYFKLIKTDIKK